MFSKRTAMAALAIVATSAPAHADITISTAATQNMSCSGGTCVPTAASAILNVSDLENDLSQFGNVTIATTGNGAEANNIVVKAAFASPDSTSLTLDAHKAIAVNAAVSIGAGTAELELQSGKGGELGTLSFGPKGHIAFGSLSDIFGINGGIFTLVGSVQGLASAIDANPGGAFALANSYDASQDGTYTSSPVATTLMGTLEGLGNTISKLEIRSRDTDVALFSQIGSTGNVSDLRLSQARVIDRRRYVIVGILAGQNFGLLFQDGVTGKVIGTNSVGGIAGTNGGTVASSRSDAAVTVIDEPENFTYGGGVVGDNSGTIRNSYAGGTVNVDYSHSTSSVGAGGVAGNSDGTIDSSFATGAINVSGGSDGIWCGGLVGIQSGTISNSYASGSATGSADLGGLVGYTAFSSTIASSYSTGAVSGSESYIGGFVGVDASNDGISDGYWDTDTSGITNLSQGAGNIANDPGITGLTTAQLQSGLPAGFSKKVWAEKPTINNGLPYLIANPPPK